MRIKKKTSEILELALRLEAWNDWMDDPPPDASLFSTAEFLSELTDIDVKPFLISSGNDASGIDEESARDILEAQSKELDVDDLLTAKVKPTGIVLLVAYPTEIGSDGAVDVHLYELSAWASKIWRDSGKASFSSGGFARTRIQ